MNDSVPHVGMRRFGLFVRAVFIFLIGFAALSAFYARHVDWNARRIAPAAAIIRGLNIYPSPDSGIVTGHIYTPLSSMLYGPFTFLPNAAWIVSCASAATTLLFVAPFIILVRWAVKRGICQAMEGAVVLAVAGLIIFLDPTLRVAATQVHTDGAAAAFGALALLCAAWGSPDRRRPFFWAGLFAVAAILTKQTHVVTWLALAAAGLVLHGRRWAGRFLLGGAVAALLVLAPVLLQTSWRDFLYNCLWVPAHHPWNTESFRFAYDLPPVSQSFGERLRALVLAFVTLAPAWWPVWATAVWCGLRFWRDDFGRNDPLARLAVLAGLAGCLQLPLSLAAMQKVGGDINALTPTFTFLLLMLVALALQRLPALVASGAWRLAAVSVLTTLCACNLPAALNMLAYSATHPDHNQAMITYLKNHPGEVYLPWDPLLTFMAEGRRDHFEYGVYDRALAGEPISAEHYRRGLPHNLRVVAVPANKSPSTERAYQYYLSDLTKINTPPELEYWNFYATGPVANAPAIRSP